MKSSVRAFTLIEILVVLAILGMLASVLFKTTGNSYDKAQVKVARLFIQTGLTTSLQRYKMDLGSYPTTAEGLAVLLTAPSSGAANWQGPYAETDGGKLQLDPWNEPYQYRYPGTKNKSKYDLYSKGPDKTEGTEDDIGNW